MNSKSLAEIEYEIGVHASKLRRLLRGNTKDERGYIYNYVLPMLIDVRMFGQDIVLNNLRERRDELRKYDELFKGNPAKYDSTREILRSIGEYLLRFDGGAEYEQFRAEDE